MNFCGEQGHLYPVFNADFSMSIFDNRVLVHNQEDLLIIGGNSDLGKLLQCCTGTKKMVEIVQENTDSQENFQRALINLAPLIDELLAKKVIKFVDNPCNAEISVKITDSIIPSVVTVELTDQCGLECVHCYQNASPRQNNFVKNPLALLKFLKDSKVQGIELTGGEPTMHPDFTAIIEYCSQNFVFYSLITNGTMLNDQHLQLLQNGKAMAVIQICLNGPDKITVDASTGITGSFEKIIHAIKLVKKYGIRLRIGMVIDSPAKIKLIEETLKMAKSLGADGFLATPVINFGRASNNFFLLDSESMNAFLEMHQYLKKNYGDFYSLESGLINDFQYVNCGAGWKNLTVHWSGAAKLCPLQPSDWFNFGHIQEIETSNVQEKLRCMSKLTAPGSDCCQKCDYLYYCMNCILRPLNLLINKRIRQDQCQWLQLHKDKLLHLGFNFSDK